MPLYVLAVGHFRLMLPGEDCLGFFAGSSLRHAVPQRTLAQPEARHCDLRSYATVVDTQRLTGLHQLGGLWRVN